MKTMLVRHPKAYFPHGEFVRASRKIVGTVSSCSRRNFSPTMILVFASSRANKVAKWKKRPKKEALSTQYLLNLLVLL